MIKEEYINKMRSLLNPKIKEEIKKQGYFKNIVRQVSSYLRFRDFNHADVPLYQDDIFMEYINDNNNKKNNNKDELKEINEKELLILIYCD